MVVREKYAKLWLGVFTDFLSRGVKDMLIACVVGLIGSPETINTSFHNTQIQITIVHMMRN